MPAVLITGAASGLGLAFLKYYATLQPSWEIFAVDRASVPAAVATDNISYFKLDITSESSISMLAQKLYSPEPIAIDLVIHSAGVRGLVPDIEQQFPADVARAETLETMNTETMIRTFHINTVGTFSLIRALLPNLKATRNSKVIVMGSRMGSISYNKSGGAYAYRASKAALNAVIKSFSIDEPEVTFAILHPGRVETGLVKCREDGAIEPEESMRDMLPLIERIGKADSGCYLDRFGAPIGW